MITKEKGVPKFGDLNLDILKLFTRGEHTDATQIPQPSSDYTAAVNISAHNYKRLGYQQLLSIGKHAAWILCRRHTYLTLDERIMA